MTIDLEGYVKSNRSNSLETFSKKINYTARTMINRPPNMVNFNLGERIFYGRMSPLSVPVVLTDQSNLKPLRRSFDSTQSQLVLNFVALLFEEMVLQFDKGVASAQIAKDEKYLSNLKVYRAYEDPWRRYQEYKNIYFKQVSIKFQEREGPPPFKNIKEFLPLLTQYLKAPCASTPFTYPSFIKSRFCDIMSSGLALEIADIKYSDDESKITHFLNSPNWNYYVTACNSYGFRIDEDRPFRIVADINSSAMREFAYKRVKVGGSGILSVLYQAAVKPYLQNLIADLVELYTLCSPKGYLATTVCPRGMSRRVWTKMPRYGTPARVFKEIGVNDILVFYMTMRINEQQPELTLYEQEKLISDCLSLYNHNGDLTFPLSIFEIIVSSTLDKRGSFAYYKEHVKEFMAEMERRGMSQNIEVSLFSEGTTAGGGY